MTTKTVYFFEQGPSAYYPTWEDARAAQVAFGEAGANVGAILWDQIDVEDAETKVQIIAQRRATHEELTSRWMRGFERAM